MSISTAWMIVRSASESSRIAFTFAIAIGVAIGVRQQRHAGAFGLAHQFAAAA